MDKLARQSQATAELDRVLARVRDDFIQRLRVQVAQLRAIQRRMPSHVEANDLKVIEFSAHQICGLAKTLGYTDLGDASQALELAVNLQLSQVGLSVNGDIPVLLESLLREMDTASASTGV